MKTAELLDTIGSKEMTLPNINVASMGTDWWAWDGDNFHPLGFHLSFEEAYEADDARLGPPSNWLHSRESLVEMVEKAQKELEK